MPSRRPLLVVLAANRADFDRWCLDSGLSRDDPEVIYADREMRLRGVADVKVIRVRGWWNHPELHALEALAQVIEHKSR